MTPLQTITAPPAELHPDYRLPNFGSKRGVLSALRDISNAAIHGVLDPRTAAAVTYALQVAVSVHNASQPKAPRRKSGR